MFERFTARARAAMAEANQQAQRFNHERIEPFHILLAIVQNEASVAVALLAGFGIDRRKVRLEVEKRIKAGPDLVTMGRLLPQAPETKAVIECAVRHAQVLGHNHVGTEHLMLGCASVSGISSEVLSDLGASYTRIAIGIEKVHQMSEPHKDAAPPSLRDDFAMAALTGMLAAIHVGHPASPPPPEIVSAFAYTYADAMLRQREQSRHSTDWSESNA